MNKLDFACTNSLFEVKAWALPNPSTSLSMTLCQHCCLCLAYAHFYGGLDDVPSSSVASWHSSFFGLYMTGWTSLLCCHLVLSIREGHNLLSS